MLLQASSAVVSKLIDAQQVRRPGTFLVSRKSLHEGGLEGMTPGSSCIANAYSNNHDKIVAKETGALKRAALHAVDALALVHALILRLQALAFPFQTLVFSGTNRAALGTCFEP